MKKTPEPAQDIILFDGVCNLCNAFVLFVIDHDPKRRFFFAPLQSEYGQGKLREHKLDCENFDSIVLVRGNRIFLRSTAVLNIAKPLKWPWPLFALFLILPTPLRNIIYAFVARNRYRWFGKQKECRLPTPELKSRFLG
jgi:predicted DCC family thiol-disulfide oxidoreductase YuxK